MFWKPNMFLSGLLASGVLLAGCGSLAMLEKLPHKSSAQTAAPAPAAARGPLLEPLALPGLKPYNHAGAVLALSVGHLAVGIPGVDENAGAVQLFHWRDGRWQFKQALPDPRPSKGCQFGRRMAMDGDTLLLSAGGIGGYCQAPGAVYEYRRDAGGTWALKATFKAPDSAPRDSFGMSVAVHQDLLAIGQTSTFRTDRPGATKNGGPVWTAVRGADGTWSKLEKLLPDGGLDHVGETFGFAVAVHNDTLLVGTGSRGLGSAKSGAYLFQRTGGTPRFKQLARLEPTDQNDWDEFGACVALSNDLAVIGAPGPHMHSGYVYIVERKAGKWGPLQNIFGDRLKYPGYAVGNAVATDGQRILVGASRGRTVYLLERAADGTWQPQPSPYRAKFEPYGEFGVAVGLDGDRMAAGDPQSDVSGESAGIVFGR